MSKRAIITGITGQDGSYLAELLLEQGYEVVGATRRLSAPNHWRIAHLLDRIELRPADLLDRPKHRLEVRCECPWRLVIGASPAGDAAAGMLAAVTARVRAAGLHVVAEQSVPFPGGGATALR